MMDNDIINVSNLKINKFYSLGQLVEGYIPVYGEDTAEYIKFVVPLAAFLWDAESERADE